jgi:hypothetical protein
MKPYTPSVAEIRARCRQIQKTWTEAERQKRAAWANQPPRMPTLGTLIQDDDDDDGNGHDKERDD